MNFADLTNPLKEENKRLKIAIAFSILISSISMVLILTQRRFFVATADEVFRERPLAVSICLGAIKSMASNKLDLNYFTPEILEQLKLEPFEFEISEVLKLESTTANHCKIILKSGEKLLAFLVALKEDKNFIYYYKMASLKELNPAKNTSEDI